ncbi:hypothetical protein DKX38_011065 [Salix brachista]|uniref:U1 small nuclear ribonucleoprotein 70 kDa n=2 Tax=Salix TaxID=40685 RepID=A0A5N5LY52_9ROSI|nr:hypothetical protein DKX38_011065 [Salix brachista]
MGDYNDAFLRNPNAAVRGTAKGQNRANVLQLKLIGQSHPTGLTANLLKLFEPRPPLEFKPPPEKRKCPPYLGMAQFVSHFAEPGDPEYAPPIKEAETPAERKARIHAARLEKGAEKAAEELQKYDPTNDPNVSGDPYKTLFVARLNYETTESRIKREFESYGPIKRVGIFEYTQAGLVRSYETTFSLTCHAKNLYILLKNICFKRGFSLLQMENSLSQFSCCPIPKILPPPAGKAGFKSSRAVMHCVFWPLFSSNKRRLASALFPELDALVRLVADKVTNKPRGYAFIEYMHTRDMKAAYKQADGRKLDGRRVLVDVERGRTVPNWRPRRLGGGLGTTRVGGEEVNQKHSGREVQQSGGSSRSEEPRTREDRHAERERDYEVSDHDRGRSHDRDESKHERDRLGERDYDHAEPENDRSWYEQPEQGQRLPDAENEPRYDHYEHHRSRGQYDHMDVQGDHDRYDQYPDRDHDRYDQMEGDDYQYDRGTSESREKEREYRRSERSLSRDYDN